MDSNQLDAAIAQPNTTDNAEHLKVVKRPDRAGGTRTFVRSRSGALIPID